MNSRPLTQSEENNLQIIRRSAGDFALLYVTAVGLAKSIFDATLPIRTLLKVGGIHDFLSQGKGPEHKVILDGIVLEDDKVSPVQISFYRPETKDGDPRMWPYLFTKYAKPDDVIAFYVHAGRIHFLNLTRSRVAEDLAQKRENRAGMFFAELNKAASSISNELLGLLRAISARGPLISVCKGDTAIGRSIEAALGIEQNPRQKPDYKGIELKSYRATKPDNGLITLFSKTPDWKRSLVKGSKDFLTRYGYYNAEKDRNQLYCSVYATKVNSLGFTLNLNAEINELEEFHRAEKQPLAVWSMETLHGNLRDKHAETFWIKANTATTPDGRECFQLHSVTHTRRPIITQFDVFILEGQICMDHTIYGEGSGAGDHGYLFRVRQEKFTQLFTGEPMRYDLG